MSREEVATRSVEDIDPRLLDFMHERVNSFIKWDLVRFFHDNPDTADTADNIAYATGRAVDSVIPELDQLVETGVFQSESCNDTIVYMLARDRNMTKLINSFILACDDHQFRIKAIYYVIRRMRGA